jgi:hypothetical protein
MGPRISDHFGYDPTWPDFDHRDGSFDKKLQSLRLGVGASPARLCRIGEPFLLLGLELVGVLG